MSAAGASDGSPGAPSAPGASSSAAGASAGGSGAGAGSGSGLSSSASSGSGSSSGASSGPAPGADATLLVKCALVGDVSVGKTSILCRYVDNRFDATLTLGVAFLEKTIALPSLGSSVTLCLWDLGGSYSALLPMVCASAVSVIFAFDLTNEDSLSSVKSWYKQVRALNKAALPFLVGTKHDLFEALPEERRIAISDKAKKYARAMGAPLVYCSALSSLNINKLFKLVFLRVFDLPITDLERTADGAVFDWTL